MKALTTAIPANLLRLGAGVLGIAAVGVLLVQGSSAAFTASTDSRTAAAPVGARGTWEQ